MSNLFLVLYCCEGLIHMPVVIMTVVLRIHVIIKSSLYVSSIVVMDPSKDEFSLQGQTGSDGVEL